MDLRDTIMHTNKHAMGFLEEEMGKKKKFIQKNKSENFLNLERKTDIQIEESQKTQLRH